MSYTKSPNSKYSRRKHKHKGQIALIPIRGKDTPALFSSKDQKHHCTNCGFGKPCHLGSAGNGVDCSSRKNAVYLDSLLTKAEKPAGRKINMDAFKERGAVMLLKGEDIEGDSWSCHFWEPQSTQVN